MTNFFLFLDLGSRYPRAAPQSRRPDCRSTRVPQEGLRDSERVGSRRRRSAGRAGGQLQEEQGGCLKWSHRHSIENAEGRMSRIIWEEIEWCLLARAGGS